MIKKQSHKKNDYSSVVLVIFFLFLILTFRSFTSKPFKVPKEVQAITGTLNFNAGIGTQTLASPNMANLYVTGNVGIGITAPNTPLHLYSAASNDGVRIQSAGTNSYARMWFQTDAASYWNVGSRNDGTSGGGLSFESNSPSWTSKLFIATAGNVGIGTTAPGTKLHIYDNASAPLVQTIENGHGTNNSAMTKYVNTDGGLWIGKERSNAGAIMTGSIAYAGVITTNSADPIQFGTNDAAAMTILSGGNVGIGTTGPGAKLEVAVGGAANGLLISGASTNGLRISPSSDANNAIFNVTNAANTVNWLTVNTNGQVLMNGTGNVGIGMTPAAKLHVAGTIAATSWIGAGCESTCETGGGYVLMYADGSIVNTSTITSTGVVNANGGLSQDGFNIINGGDTWLRTSGATGWYNASYGGGMYMIDASYVRTYASKPIAAQYYADQDSLGYYVDPNGTSVLNSICAGGSCADYLTNDGSYLKTVGDFRVSGTFYNDGAAYSTIWYDANNGAYYADPSYLSVLNSIRIPTYCGANCGIIYFSDTNASINRQSNNLLFGTAWTYIGAGVSDFFGNISYRLVSDSRLKKNIKEISNSMEILNGLKGVTFDWRYDEEQFKDNKLPHEKNDVGLIAQEVEKVLPQAVGTDPTNGYKNVAYTKVIPVLVEVAKEQQTQIVSLQSITTDFISKFKEGLIETKKLIVDGVDVLKKLNELSLKVESQQKQIEELQKVVKELKK